MNEYRKGTHSIFRLHIHVVWCTKYRKKVLFGDIGNRLRDLVRQGCSELRVEILSGAVAKEASLLRRDSNRIKGLQHVRKSLLIHHIATKIID